MSQLRGMINKEWDGQFSLASKPYEIYTPNAYALEHGRKTEAFGEN